MQLGKLLEEVYIACGLQVLRRMATGGSTTTVVDSAYTNKRGDNYFAQGANGGHILFVSVTTDGLAPQGQFGEVSGFVNSGGPTFTVPTMTAAAGSGDIYSVMKPVVQLYEMIARVNEGLRRLGEQDRPNTTLTTLADTLAYTLPSGVNATNIKKIEIGSDDPDYGWRDVPGYSIQPQAAGTGDQLIFTAQPPYDSTTPANYTIKITYHGPHPTLSAYSDYVEKSIADELAIAVCAESAWEYLMQKRPASYGDKTKLAQYQSIQARSQQAQFMYPIRSKPGNAQRRFNFGEL